MLGFMGAWVGSIQKKNILLTKLRPTSEVGQKTLQ